ncbi:flagellar biosynthetic protein FliO [Pelagibius sp.]|uniref:flagellar biosynthetic protein FliO n=1 Tax=Pelagibius sp. TaxID=1931238 RepID=UPI00261C2477|nr:flagellar biosynthetic protein FliO [Pelagibius sp.]
MDLAEYVRFFLALGFVLVLIAGLAALVRRSGLGDRLAVTKSNGPRRLDLVEVRPIDAKRKLVLIRRDDREHLVLLGHGSDLLIESAIPARPASESSIAARPAVPSAETADNGPLARVAAKLRGAVS